MRIQNNIMAMNTHRFYTANNNAVSKSAEKLSSGYRVNRAGDDAAGLAISEKMRAEIRGLSMASKNSQDGISMVQTAEGALTEVHAMLQRMKELAVQSSSDSNADKIDRPALDQEFQQLISEIDDVAKTTTFNDMNLLDGTFTGKVIQIGSRSGNEMKISIGNMNAASLGLRGATEEAVTVEGGDNLAVAVTDGAATDDVATVDLANVKVSGPGKVDVKIGEYSATVELTADDVKDAKALAAKIAAAEFKNEDGDTATAAVDSETKIKLTGATGDFTGTPTASIAAAKAEAAEGADDAADANEAAAAGLTAEVTLSDAAAANDTVKFTSDGETQIDVTFTLGADDKWTLTGGTAPEGYDVAFDGSKLSITPKEGTEVPDKSPFGEISAAPTIAGQGAATATVDNDGATWSTGEEAGGAVNLLSQKSASAAIEACYKALNLVSTQRAELGAIQNRLEHKISNLDNTVENVSAAEARIRDVDIAKEMTNFTKNQILSQAATAMLAQANSLPQNVLSLLQ